MLYQMPMILRGLTAWRRGTRRRRGQGVLEVGVRTTRQLVVGEELMIRASEGEERTTWMVMAQTDWALEVVPLVEDAALAWSSSVRVVVCFRRSGDASYTFTTRMQSVAGRTLALRHSDQLERRQLRGFFRWNTRFVLALFAGAYRNQAGQWAIDDSIRLEGTVLDISGGGLCVQLPEEQATQEHIVVDPHFRGPFPLAGVTCQIMGSRGNGQHSQLRLRFVDLPSTVEARIVRAIYHGQLGRKEPDHPEEAV